MSNLPPIPPSAASPEDDGTRPNRRLARALLLGLIESQVPLRERAVTRVCARSTADGVGVASHWLRFGGAPGPGPLNPQVAVSQGLVAAGQTGLAFHLLAQPLSMSPAGRHLTSPAGRAQAIDVLAGMATEHLASRDAEPGLDLPQAVIDGAQSALWLLRSDKRHWSAAQRLLLVRTEALRRQMASGARELRYADLPTASSVLQALDRSVTWLRLMSLGDVAALGLTPQAPEQPLPPGWDDGESA